MLPILQQSYWRDEAFSVLLASKGLKDIVFLTIKDNNPPLYYFFLHFWMRMFGDVEYVTRSLSLFFLFFLALSSFFLLKVLLKNWKVSLLGSLAILLNPFLIEYAFEARAYMLFALLVVVSTLFFLKKKYLLSSLFLGLMIFTHNFGILFLIPFFVFWLLNNKEGLKSRINSFSSLFIFPILVFIGWLQVFWNQWTKVAEGFWIEPKTSAVFIETFRNFFRGSKDYSSLSMLYNLTIALVFLGFSYWIAKIVKEDRESTKKDYLLLVFLFSIPTLIVYIISSFWVPIFHERFLIPVLPIFIIFIVYSLFNLFNLNKTLSYFVFGLSLAYIFFGIQSCEEIMRKTTKPAINYAVRQVLSVSDNNDAIIPESNLNFLEVKYYVERYGRSNPVYAYSSDGKIPFYIGSVLFEDNEIIKEYPKDKKIWLISSDGGYSLKKD